MTRTRLTDHLYRVGCDWHFVFMGYGDHWRERRRIFHQHFHPTAALQYRPRAIHGARVLIQRLLETPDDFMMHLRQYVLCACSIHDAEH